mgnify:CR=1 FL=1
MPIVEKTTNTVTLNTLISGGYIETLDKYLKKADSCDATVVVMKTSTDYDYVPHLNCGEDYISIELYKKVLEDNALVSTGIGLYNINGEKVFRGEVKNNFILLNNNYWRIVRVDKDNNLVLISHFKSDVYPWDNRYNQDINTNDGINDYNISRIKEKIESNFYNENLLSDSDKNKLVYSKACIGMRKYDDPVNIEGIECSEYTEEEVPIRLLTVGEYLLASIDPNCTTLQSKSCINYNYMNDLKSSFWTITKSQKNSAYVYNITTNGVSESRANSVKQVRYVISLGEKAFYLSGSGTYNDPYKIK